MAYKQPKVGHNNETMKVSCKKDSVSSGPSSSLSSISPASLPSALSLPPPSQPSSSSSLSSSPHCSTTSSSPPSLSSQSLLAKKTGRNEPEQQNASPLGGSNGSGSGSSSSSRGSNQGHTNLTRPGSFSSCSPAAVVSPGSGNKCGKCQNHEVEISKKGHARDCPFKKCDCRRCRLLDARSDILQVISGKETKLKGTKKDPNCGFCQNHGIKILRKGHVRSCGFGQERHFRLDDCFDCEVHYIRNEVNRLQIKMRRAMKEDRTLSEEQRKTAREAITRDEVEKVCDMARAARKKRETVLKQQVGSGTESEVDCKGASPMLLANNAGPSQRRHLHNYSPASSTGSMMAIAAPLANVKSERKFMNTFVGVSAACNGGSQELNRKCGEHVVAGASADGRIERKEELRIGSSLGHQQLQQHQYQHQHQLQMKLQRQKSYQMSRPNLVNKLAMNGHYYQREGLQSMKNLTEQTSLGDVWRPWSQQIVAGTQHSQPQYSSRQRPIAHSPNNFLIGNYNVSVNLGATHSVRPELLRANYMSGPVPANGNNRAQLAAAHQQHLHQNQALAIAKSPTQTHPIDMHRTNRTLMSMPMSTMAKSSTMTTRAAPTGSSPTFGSQQQLASLVNSTAAMIQSSYLINSLQQQQQQQQRQHQQQQQQQEKGIDHQVRVDVDDDNELTGRDDTADDQRGEHGIRVETPPLNCHDSNDSIFSSASDGNFEPGQQIMTYHHHHDDNDAIRQTPPSPEVCRAPAPSPELVAQPTHHLMGDILRNHLRQQQHHSMFNYTNATVRPFAVGQTARISGAMGQQHSYRQPIGSIEHNTDRNQHQHQIQPHQPHYHQQHHPHSHQPQQQQPQLVDAERSGHRSNPNLEEFFKELIQLMIKQQQHPGQNYTGP